MIPSNLLRNGLFAGADLSGLTEKEKLARILANQFDPRTGRLTSGGGFDTQIMAGDPNVGAGVLEPRLVPDHFVNENSQDAGFGTEVIADQSAPLRTEVVRRSGRGAPSFESASECYIDKFRNEDNKQDCEKYRKSNEGLSGANLRAIENRDQRARERADIKRTTAKRFPMRSGAANFLYPRKSAKWRSDFTRVLTNMISKVHDHSSFAEKNRNDYRYSVLGGCIYEGKGHRGWEDSEVYMMDSYDPSAEGARKCCAYFAGCSTKGDARIAEPWNSEPGAGTQVNAVAHVSCLSVSHGDARAVFEKSVGDFQDTANRLQLPEIVGIPNTSEVWVFTPQYDKSRRYYTEENNPWMGTKRESH